MPTENSKKKVEKRSGASKWETFKRIVTDPRTRMAFGAVLIFITLYLTLAFVSYFFTCEADYSIVSQYDSFFDYLLAGSARNNVQNWTGSMGAYISYRIIYKGFGAASFFLLGLVLLAGVRLLTTRISSTWKYVSMLLIMLFWFSTAISFFFFGLYKDGYYNFGGQVGHRISTVMEKNVGSVGAFLLLLLVFVLFLIFFHQDTLPALKRLSIKAGTWLKSLFARSRQELLEEGNEEELKTEESENMLVTDAEEQKDEKNLETLDRRELESSPLNVEGNGNWEVYPAEKEITHTEPIDDLTESEREDESSGWTISDDENDSPQNELHISDEDGPEMVINTPQTEEATDLGLIENDTYDASGLGEYDPKLDLSRYMTPPMSLLKDYGNGQPAVDVNEQNANKNRIITTLSNYGIEIVSINATVGPTITLYEIVPKAGTRISKIKNLESEIMLSLAAIGIRIIAPIPGKGTIGIEVPNEHPQTVSMLSVLNSKRFQDAQQKYKLPVAIGKTITNEVFTFDLTKTPHVLVAGATGQGKSVGLNAIITSLLYSMHPAYLKFVLVDPKKVEFSIYNKIERHFLAKMSGGEEAIITDVTKVVQTLNSLTKEMDERYDLLKKAGVRTIAEYNDKFIHRKLNPEKGHRFLPYIVVVIDEFGDLIMVAGKEVELPIARIAQLARAIGIHMILATQRPSTNIITGIIKANFPTRIAFRVSSMVDSRTILDASGAQHLIGRGDLLFSKDGETSRVQCAFVDTPEVEEIVDYIGSQQGYPTAFELPECDPDAGSNIGGGSGGSSAADFDPHERDSMFVEAARLIVQTQQGSTSNIQRKFSIGYNRAGRIMDQLEAAGIVGPFEGSKARQVLVPDEITLEQKLNSMIQ